MTDKPNEQDPLRTTAETKLAHASESPPADELLHELKVHQIELQMQNEALRQSQIELEESRDKFMSLYDFAPVGYITLNHEAMIDEINLTAATLLGIERNKLTHRRFASFIAAEDRDRWYRHFLNLFTHNDTLTCELPLVRGDGSHFYAQLGCMHLKKNNESVLRIVLTDISERKRTESQIAEQLHELRRWHDTMLGREMRVLKLKHEVNELLAQYGQPLRYPCAKSDNTAS